jgi:hypothetical protein
MWTVLARRPRAVSAQHAELQRVPAPVVVAATPADFGEIGCRQAPVPGELVLGRLRWKRNPPPRAGLLREVVIY